MEVGDIIQINGNFGFLTDPKMKVLKVKESLVLLEPVGAKEGGLLSHTNQTWNSIELIKKKMD